MDGWDSEEETGASAAAAGNNVGETSNA